MKGKEVETYHTPQYLDNDTAVRYLVRCIVSQQSFSEETLLYNKQEDLDATRSETGVDQAIFKN